MDKLSNHSTLLLVFLTPICATFSHSFAEKRRLRKQSSFLVIFAFGSETISSKMWICDSRTPDLLNKSVNRFCCSRHKMNAERFRGAVQADDAAVFGGDYLLEACFAERFCG